DIRATQQRPNASRSKPSNFSSPWVLSLDVRSSGNARMLSGTSSFTRFPLWTSTAYAPSLRKSGLCQIESRNDWNSLRDRRSTLPTSFRSGLWSCVRVTLLLVAAADRDVRAEGPTDGYTVR